MPGSEALPSGFRLWALDSIDSTNDEALRRIAAGAGRHGDVIVARSQTAGRGRRGRSWQSPPGNLHLTLLVCPPAGARVGELAFVSAVAAGEAVAGIVPPAAELRYKWPNDLLLGGRKLAGLLIEAGGTDKDPALAIGIGINVASAPESTEFPATSLRQAGCDVPADALVGPLCRAFAAWYDRWLAEGFAPVRTAWLARAHGVGGPIEARLPDASVHRGIFLGLDGNGALMLESGDGAVRTIAAGDVFFAAA